MVVLIDGYNLLRHCYPRVKGYMDVQKRHFLHDVAIYRHARSETVKELIVVFDAGERDHATREVKQGVVIIHSGQKSSADDWIVSYVARNSSQEIALITMDRGLKQRCGNILTLDVDDFFSYVRSVVTATYEPKILDPVGSDSIIRYDSKDAPVQQQGEDFYEDECRRKLVDQLMETHSFMAREHRKKDDDGARNLERHKTASKEEKKLRKSIKKL